jgi:hypothetical protein
VVFSFRLLPHLPDHLSSCLQTPQTSLVRPRLARARRSRNGKVLERQPRAHQLHHEEYGPLIQRSPFDQSLTDSLRFVTQASSLRPGRLSSSSRKPPRRPRPLSRPSRSGSPSSNTSRLRASSLLSRSRSFSTPPRSSPLRSSTPLGSKGFRSSSFGSDLISERSTRALALRCQVRDPPPTARSLAWLLTLTSIYC